MHNKPYQTLTYRTFESLPNKYDSFFESTNNKNLFLTRPWLNNLLQNVFSKQNIYIFTLESRDGTPLILLPTYLKEENPVFFKTTQLTGLSNYYTSLFEPLLSIKLEQQQDAIEKLIQHICATIELDIVDFSPLDNQLAPYASLIKALANNNFIIETYFSFGNWYMELNGETFDHYYTSLSSKLKNTIKQKTNKLTKEQDYEIKLITKLEDIDQYIGDFVQIYNKSWKKKEPYPDFIPGLIKTSAKQNWLRLGLLYINNKPAAAQIWIVCNNTANIYKLAYDQEYSMYSTGSILTKYLMKYVIDIDKVNTIDYLTGDDSYKKDWMSKRRERWGICAYNKKTKPGIFKSLTYYLKNVIKFRFSTGGKEKGL